MSDFTHVISIFESKDSLDAEPFFESAAVVLDPADMAKTLLSIYAVHHPKAVLVIEKDMGGSPFGSRVSFVGAWTVEDFPLPLPDPTSRMIWEDGSGNIRFWSERDRRIGYASTLRGAIERATKQRGY